MKRLYSSISPLVVNKNYFSLTFLGFNQIVKESFTSKFSKERILKSIETKKKLKELSKNLTENMQTNIKVSQTLSKKIINVSPIDAFNYWNKMDLSKEIQEKRCVNMVFELNIKKDVIIRGVREMPGGCTKLPKICVFTTPGFEKAALDAGADKVANANTYEEIKNKQIDYDVYLCTMDVMPQVKLLGRILGPIGLMPNPKVGTAINPDLLEETIRSYKRGNKEFKTNKNGFIYISLGKYHFGEENLFKNLNAFLTALDLKKAEGSKLSFIKSAWISLGGVKKSFSLDLSTIDIKSNSYFYNKYKKAEASA